VAELQTNPTGPGNRPMSRIAIVVVALYLVLTSVLVLYGLIKIWPHPTPSGEPKVEAQTTRTSEPSESPPPKTSAEPSPSPPTQAPASGPAATPERAVTTSPSSSPSPSPANGKAQPEPEVISFFGGRLRANIYAERRLLLIVILAGALGSLMHALRSLYWYTGNRLMMWSWVGFYLLLPFSGSILAVIFYFVVRGGFFSPQASFGDTSPFGFAALSALVGLFSSPATLKLKEVAETIFTKPQPGADAKAQGSSSETRTDETTTPAKPVPTVESVDPAQVAAGSKPQMVTVSGTGFIDGSKVNLNDQPQETTFVESGNLTAQLDDTLLAASATLKLTVVNPDGNASTPVDFVVT
jgi:hypothetical protein